MMRVVSAIVLAVCSMWLFCQPAFADRRIALVIGNSAYERVPKLPNPVRDAVAMAEMFKGAGFDSVQLKLDVKATEMRRALRDFSDDARNADIAIIYFAGHGLEIQGTNYLVPSDAVLERDIDAYDEAISLDRLLSVIEPARQLRLVILDACRDNPFSKSMKHAIVSRSVDRGLAKVEPVGPNTLVAFAAKAGSTADDGDASHSPFTAALVKFLPQPGLDLRRAFGYVRDDVLKVTRNRQEPFIYGSLGGDDVPLVPAPVVAAPSASIVDPNTAARDDYELASQINVVSAWDSYIRKYPSGFYSDLAKAQREKLMANRVAMTEQARLTAERKAAEDAKAAEAERQRLAVQAKAAQDKAAQEKAAQDAKLAADKVRAEEAAREAAKAAQAREAAERQKALAEARAAEEARLAAERRAAEEARLVAEKKAASEAKAAQEARLAAERKAAEDARAAEAARAKAAQAKAADTNTRLAAVLPGDARLGQQAGDPHPAAGCTGAAQQQVSLSPDTARALSLPEECGLKPKDSFKECQNCPEMVVVPAGEFLMGSSKDEIDNELAAANEAPQHKVTVKQTIAIGRFEITRDQYAAFVNATGYRGSGRCVTFEQNIPRERDNRSFLAPGYAQDGNHPAVCVSWTDARAYADWLSKATGKNYRLLSEAEYEYAARAGGRARYGFTDDAADLCRFANGADQSAKTAGLPPNAPYMACGDGFPFTAPIGSFAANAFGLHDLIGNVWEWTADCFADDYRSAGSDSAAHLEPDCNARTVRGGDWFSTPSSLRPAVRAKADQEAHNDDIGFRVARVLAH
jgi:formylglycine-generating enzyme required for sulfatase activity